MERFLPQRTKQKVGTATSQQQEQLHGTSELKLATCSTSLVATVQPFTDGEPPSPNIIQQQLIIEPPSSNIVQQQLIIEPPSSNIVQQQLIIEPPSSNIVQQQLIIEPPSPNIIQQQLIIEPPSSNIVQQQLMITTANTQLTCIATDTEQVIYDHSRRMAEEVGSSVSVPRIMAARPQHRSNMSSDSPLDYDIKNVAIPFLDHISTHLAEQFSSLTITAGSILGMVPSVMHSKEINLSRIVEVYHVELLELELMRWKSKYSDVPYEKLPSLPSSVIKDCDAEI